MSTPEADTPTLGHLISPDLIKGLKQVFPATRPSPDATDRSIWMRFGAQEVIEFLELEQERALEDSMKA